MQRDLADELSRIIKHIEDLCCLLVASRDLETIFVHGSYSIAFEARLVDHRGKLLRILDISLAIFPPGCVQEAISLCI